METEYENYTLTMEGQQGDQELYFRLYYQENEARIEVWNCRLEGLWENEDEKGTPDLIRCWNLHQEGDYFQQTITKLDKSFTHISFTAIFHEIIRNNRADFDLINNIYSTSTLEWLSMGYTIFPDATRFWSKQVENGLAQRIEEELRFKAILEDI